MAVTIKIGKIQATVSDGKWKSRDPDLEAMLNGLYTEEDIIDYSPWPDYTLAEMAVDDAREAETQAEIVKTTDEPDYVEGRIY